MDLVTALRLALAVGLAYAFTVLLLRLTGNRTLSKLRAFDFVVTVALGSLLASAAQETGAVPWRSIVGIGLLVVLQTGVAWMGARSRRWERLVTAPPRLLYYKGEHREDEMRRARVSHEEVRMAMRKEGHGQPDRVLAVILEPSGDLSVLPEGASGTLPQRGQ